MITDDHGRADITMHVVIKRALFFICSSTDPWRTCNRSANQTLLFHRLDEQHLCAALGDERTRRSYLLIHLPDEQISSGLMILEARGKVDIPFYIDDSNSVSGFRARRGAVFLCWAAVAPSI